MASIKGVNRSAWVALAPDAPYLAAGTMAGAVDLSFSSSANLELFKLDFQSDDHELPVIAECPSAERFNRLAWGKRASWSDDFSLGLLAGGLVDGSIHVRGLEFNAFTSNLLASGADDGEVCIWDLAAPAEQALFSSLKGSGSYAQGEISFLSWNSKIQHILASTSYNATTVVWDLKRQKPVISFSDKDRRRCSVLQWNPDVVTQLVVASDEDDSPLRLWDMRQMMSPLREFKGHEKGVIAMSWCPIDSSYLLTCGKDNRTICWDTNTGEIVGELPAGTNWNFDVHWYPEIPGVISASSFDGKIDIYNIQGCSRYGGEEDGFGAASLRAPRWYKRPVGLSFGFGGKLVSFRLMVSSGGASATSDVFVHDLVSEQSLVSRSSEFQSAIQNGERPSLRILCETKSEQSESVDDRETWGFLKVMFEDDGTARTKLLVHLGFSLPEEEKIAVEDELSQGVDAVVLEDKMEHDTLKDENGFAFDNGEDFFNNLPSPKADTPVSTSNNSFVVESNDPGADQVPQVPDELEESTNSFDDAVQQALVVGDYKGAVTQCLSANKIADALVIAHVGGATLWESIRDQYLKMSRSPYLKTVTAMVNNDVGSLVHTRPLKFWKETLALLCTFAQREEWTRLCDALASKLMSGIYTLPATLCFMCAGNIDKTVEIWSRSLTSQHEGKSYVDLLQELMEKTIVLALATGQKKISASLCKLVEKYVEILASQGLLTTALEYVKLLDTDELSPELVILKDLLSTEPDKQTKDMLENHQGNVGATFEAQQQLYLGLPTSQTQPSVLGSSYDGYRQTYSPYGGGYQASSYQTHPQPQPQPQLQRANMFVPSEAPHVSQGTFAPLPASTQPAMRTFVPSNPQALRNPEQYYQAPTLGSQLYPGASNPPYPVPPSARIQSPTPMQVGSVPAPKMPEPVPTVPLSGFIPVTNPVGAQRPAIVSSQPASPTKAPPQPAAAPPAPPHTVQTVNTSNVPAHLRPIVTTLTRLFNETSEALGGPHASVPRKREIDENSKKIGALFTKLNSGDISNNASDKLIQLCQALDNKDFATSLQMQALLTTTEWGECNFWLASLKRMMRLVMAFT